MKEYELKYGCNPTQRPARLFMPERDGGAQDFPFEILNGRPGYINFLDALNAWQLVRELRASSGLPAAASFKHVSPAGAAVGRVLSGKLKRAVFSEDIEGLDESLQASAYARARGCDRVSSYGDFAALSDCCDLTTARLLQREVSDGVIAPDFTEEALALLRKKKGGSYNILRMDPSYLPDALERRQVFGIGFEQLRDSAALTREGLSKIVSREKALPEEAVLDLMTALIAAKYTQSNSVCYALDGQTIGVGAGQQSRIHCTRLAGEKAELWFLRQSERVLDLPFLPGIRRAERDNCVDAYLSRDSRELLAEGEWQKHFSSRPEPFTEEEKRDCLRALRGVSLASDAFFPFGDNVKRAAKSGVSYIAEPGGSVRDEDVIEEADRHGMVLIFTGRRLFHH